MQFSEFILLFISFHKILKSEIHRRISIFINHEYRDSPCIYGVENYINSIGYTYFLEHEKGFPIDKAKLQLK